MYFDANYVKTCYKDVNNFYISSSKNICFGMDDKPGSYSLKLWTLINIEASPQLSYLVVVGRALSGNVQALILCI